jgi:adenylate kinase family enzyme
MKSSFFRAVILQAPGISGKGTISGRIVKKFGVTHMSSRDMLRAYMATKTD